MTREDLDKIEGLTPEQKNEIMRLHGLDVQAWNTEKGTLNTTVQNLQTQLETAQTGLKAFEGVDVNALQGQIATLNTKLATQAAAFAFDGVLRRAAREANAIDEDDVIALLPNRDTLQASANQDADVKAAMKALAEKKPHLFKAADHQDQDEHDNPDDQRLPILTPKPRSPQGGDPSLDEFLTMNGTQRLEMKRKNPALFQQLMQKLAARR